MQLGPIFALLAALLFGLSTPFAKMLTGHIVPQMLAGLLYAGSGLGLLAWYLLRLRFANDNLVQNNLTKKDLPWLGGAILFGGVFAPVLLMLGLTSTPASTASLLLNLEGVLTTTLAWFVFKENYDKRIMLGMGLIVLGGLLLSWQRGQSTSVSWSALAIAAACLCWAIDNNLTRKVSASDPVQIAGLKGLIAGVVNLGIAMLLGHTLPIVKNIALAGLVGFAGYGVSLVMFVLALRHIGTARTGAYFSAAPFMGVIVSMLLFNEVPDGLFWLASILMSIGVWLHLSEHHEHAHLHESLEHSHQHEHDAHHQHTHAFEWNNQESHTHAHQHTPMIHAHPHFPDIHHQHSH